MTAVGAVRNGPAKGGAPPWNGHTDTPAAQQPRSPCAEEAFMTDLHDRVARLAEEAQSRAGVAGTQAAWQEGRAHGLREAPASSSG